MIQKNQFIKHDSFIIFGTGVAGIKAQRILNRLGKKIVCFLVSKKTAGNELFSGVPLISLEETDRIDDKSIPVIVAVFNSSRNSGIPYIVGLLKQQGLTTMITYFEFHQIFANELEDVYWLTKASFYKDNHSKFLECARLFTEEKSRRLYHEIIRLLDTFDPDILSEPDPDNQYFPEDLNTWDGSGAFIDLGCYDGENIRDAANKYGTLSKVIAFEPDLDNFKNINNLTDWPSVATESYIYPCGVWSKTQMLRFSSGEGVSSSISEQGDTVIPVVALDDVLQGVEPGFIKMDVEGAEIEALQGARSLIARHRPTLAICLYHRPDHLFNIQLQIHSWDLGYRFFLRFHGPSLYETVLYCML